MEPFEQLSVEQQIALDNEIKNAYGLIRYGTNCLIDAADRIGFERISFLLLSSGFERLLKCTLFYHYFYVEKRVLNNHDLRNYGHNIQSLLNDLISCCFATEYRNSCEAAKSDFVFLTEDYLFKTFVKVISDYAIDGRYYELNVITNSQQKTRSIMELWNDVAKEAFYRSNIFEVSSSGDLVNPQDKGSIAWVVSIIETSVRAISRLYTFGLLGPDAKRMYVNMSDFLSLTDEDIRTGNKAPRMMI